MSLRDSAQRLGLGRLSYRLWHQPISRIRQSVAEGGPLQQWITAKGRRAMIHAASALPRQAETTAPPGPEVHFLTGRKFWDQTAFCLHSLQRHAGRVFPVVLHDDGTLDPPTTSLLRSLFPGAEIRSRAENDARLAALLPPDRFPFLHERRRRYPNILKLTDAHAGARGWRLVLDSDMLFFRRPDFLLDWLSYPHLPLHMVDVGDAYGYPERLMTELAGAPIPHSVNVGLTGLQSDTLDWEKLEYWCRRLITTHGTHYYLEQGLIAMLVAGKARAIAPAADYLLAPDDHECRVPRAVLHHYVGLSKRGYFRHAWRHLAARDPI